MICATLAQAMLEEDLSQFNSYFSECGQFCGFWQLCGVRSWGHVLIVELQCQIPVCGATEGPADQPLARWDDAVRSGEGRGGGNSDAGSGGPGGALAQPEHAPDAGASTMPWIVHLV